MPKGAVPTGSTTCTSRGHGLRAEYQKLPLASFFILTIVRYCSSEARTSVFPKWAQTLFHSLFGLKGCAIVPSGEMWPLLAVHGRTHSLRRHHRGDDLGGRAGWLGLQTLPDQLCKSRRARSGAVPVLRGHPRVRGRPPSRQTVSSSAFATLLSSRAKSHSERIYFQLHQQWCGWNGWPGEPEEMGRKVLTVPSQISPGPWETRGVTAHQLGLTREVLIAYTKFHVRTARIYKIHLNFKHLDHSSVVWVWFCLAFCLIFVLVWFLLCQRYF